MELANLGENSSLPPGFETNLDNVDFGEFFEKCLSDGEIYSPINSDEEGPSLKWPQYNEKTMAKKSTVRGRHGV